MTDMLPKLPPIPSEPKSTVCEVKRWIVTTVKEAQHAREQFVRVPSRSGDDAERCEVFRWVRASVDEVIRPKVQDPGRDESRIARPWWSASCSGRTCNSLSSEGNGLNHFVVDGIVITDQNHAANDPFFDSVVNNVKTLGWNSNNAALRLNDSTAVSNVFIRSSDDSLMMWGTGVTVSNATVWQGYNGGVVNLGWSNNSEGNNNLLDGLWVVKTDWLEPAAQSWNALSQPGPPNPLNSQNNAVFASLMVPSTMYGQLSPPLFRNIYVEDPPQVLFSLKIAPSVNCPDKFCSATFLEQCSKVSLNIENLYSPQSKIDNSIGFQRLPAGYIANGEDPVSYFPTEYTLTGTMIIRMTNVWVKLPVGLVVPLTGFDAAWFGRVLTNGDVTVKYKP